MNCRHSYIASRFYLHNPPGEHIVVETVHTHDEEHGYSSDVKHPVLYDDLTPVAPHASKHRRAYSVAGTGDDEEDRERLISHIEREHGASQAVEEGAEHHEPPEIGPWVAVVLLIIVIGLLSVTAEWVSLSWHRVKGDTDYMRLDFVACKEY